MKHFEEILPEGYREALVIDAKNTKLGLLLNLIAAAIAVGAAVLGIFLFQPSFQDVSLLHLFLFIAVMLAYIVLHELVHGAVYKLLTKRKLKFGITLTVAFCGVPDVYVYRRAAMLALLAPFTVFTLVFGGLTLWLPFAWDKLAFLFLLGLHIGGCSGDLYVAGLYLFKFRNPTVLMQDIGPKQTFYVKE